MKIFQFSTIEAVRPPNLPGTRFGENWSQISSLQTNYDPETPESTKPVYPRAVQSFQKTLNRSEAPKMAPFGELKLTRVLASP